MLGEGDWEILCSAVADTITEETDYLIILGILFNIPHPILDGRL